MHDLSWLAKTLIGVGAFILFMGLIVLAMSKIEGIGRLPGDIYFKRGNFTFYFPLVTSIILSLVLTAILNIFFRR
ncbi:MAG: DUF2905 domain-containing protein [Clostridia bacterium]|jgi:hypothetical protein|nr:DUF2905 domain-containing protein [Clostridia bacterium]